MKSAAALMIALAIAPVSLLFEAALRYETYAPLGYGALAAALGFAAGLPARRRLLSGGVASLALIGTFAAARGWEMFLGYWAIPFAMFIAAELWISLICAARPAGQEFTPQALLFACAGHMMAAGIARAAVFDGIRTTLWIITIFYFILCAFRLNELAVASGASLRRTGAPPSRIRSRNAMFVAVIAAITALFANANRIGGAIKRLITWVIAGILWLMSRFDSTSETPAAPDGGGGIDIGALAGDAEPSLLAVWLERIVSVLAVIIIICAAIWALIAIARAVRRLWLRLAERFRRLARELNQVYQDEAESLFDWGEIKREIGTKLRAPFMRAREPRWASLDNRAKIRYAVRVLLRRKPDLPVSETVRALICCGALPTGAADAWRLARDYDIARYSAQEPDGEAAENAGRAMR
jgi:hypothetical protein